MSCRKTSFYYDKFAWELVKDSCVKREILKLIKASGGGGSVSLQAGSGITITGTGSTLDPFIISATGGGGGSSQEPFFLQFESDGSTSPTFTELQGATLIWFEVEDIPYGIPDEVSLNTSTGQLNITGGIGAGQRVKLQFKKLP